MNKPSKCKNCQWYGKPYWSIINPCDSCPNENDYKTIITIDGEPVFKEALTDEQIAYSILDKAELTAKLEEKDKEIERLNNIIDELNKQNIELGEELSLTKDKMNKEIYKREYIINELENFIKTYSIPEFTLKEPHREFMETKIILDKLKELKEGKE